MMLEIKVGVCININYIIKIKDIKGGSEVTVRYEGVIRSVQPANKIVRAMDSIRRTDIPHNPTRHYENWTK